LLTLQDVTVEFARDVNVLAPLIDCSFHEGIPEGTRLSLPFWMSTALNMRSFVEFGYPSFLRPAYVQALTADAKKMCLSKDAPSFFESFSIFKRQYEARHPL
jgi:hypothetical protein